jgi:C-terminal processing protease CtpA/Prc
LAEILFFKMKNLLKPTLLFIILSCPLTGFSQPLVLDSIQTERVAMTCQLWGHLKYFHPETGNNAVDWESAFADHIEEVIASKTGEEFGHAVQKMIDRLNDPATRVLMKKENDREDDGVKYPVVTFLQDSILLLSIRDYRDLGDFNYGFTQVSSFIRQMPLSHGVIIDLRSPESPGEFKGYLEYYFSGNERNFSTSELKFPGLRARFHDGFVPETGGTSGGYYSGFYTKEERTISPAPTAVDKPIVFLANEHADIPKIALALQLAGKATIVSTGPLTDASIVETYDFKLEDGLAVRLRLNELPPGFDLKADYTIPSDAEESVIMEIARQLAKGHPADKIPLQQKETEPNPVNEKNRSENSGSSYPGPGHRLLAAARIWTVIDYFFAYKDLMESDWNEVLRQFIPRFASAADSLEYHLTVVEMYKHIQDGHGFFRSSVLSDHFGTASPPIRIRFIENAPVVTEIFPDSVFEVRGIEVGDVILEIDGEDYTERFERYAEYIAASNTSWLYNSIARWFLNGSDSTTVNLKLGKGNGSVESVNLLRTYSFNRFSNTLNNGRNHEPVTRLINDQIGYADLDRLTVDMVGRMFEDFKDTKAIIFDMRGYPNGTAWAIAPHLTDKEEVYAANFRRYSPMGMNIGSAKHMTFFDQAIPPPRLPTYRGKTFMLIDERTISQAEHSGLFFEAANGTQFIGSQTAGANGDVTNFQIPGNITLFFSGHDVRHIDGRQLQKTGLVPDIHVNPTIKGIREGRDEVLEKAIEHVNSILDKK